MEQILLQHGLPGVIIMALAWAWRQERARVDAVQDARIADLQKFSDLNAAVAREAGKAIDALTDALEGKK
jgi:aryl carrier-like protein